jgi:hypothetical protein
MLKLPSRRRHFPFMLGSSVSTELEFVKVRFIYRQRLATGVQFVHLLTVSSDSSSTVLSFNELYIVLLLKLL